MGVEDTVCVGEMVGEDVAEVQYEAAAVLVEKMERVLRADAVEKEVALGSTLDTLGQVEADTEEVRDAAAVGVPAPTWTVAEVEGEGVGEGVKVPDTDMEAELETLIV